MLYFILFCAILLVIVVWRLLKTSDTKNTQAKPYLLGIIALPMASALIYLLSGTPQVFFQAPINDQHLRNAQLPDSVERQKLMQEIANLENMVATEPGNITAWSQLSQRYRDAELLAKALSASTQLLRLQPHNADFIFNHAELMALNDNNKFSGDTGKYIKQSVEKYPDHAHGLWLAGLVALQENDFDSASNYWRKLENVLPADAPIVEKVKRIRETLEKQTALTQSTQTPDQFYKIKVKIDQSLQSKLRDESMVYIIARTVGRSTGPPLAVLRTPSDRINDTLFLHNGHSLSASSQLFDMNEIILYAKLSLDGAPTSTTNSYSSQPFQLKSSYTDLIELHIGIQ